MAVGIGTGAPAQARGFGDSALSFWYVLVRVYIKQSEEPVRFAGLLC
jgi:hypothetical protein